MPPIPEAIIRVPPPFAPRFSHRVRLRARLLLLGAMPRSAPHTALASLQRIGRATNHHLTHDRAVLDRAIWSAPYGSQIISGSLITLLVPLGARGRGWGR
jgi:hypothetical protein